MLEMDEQNEKAGGVSGFREVGEEKLYKCRGCLSELLTSLQGLKWWMICVTRALKLEGWKTIPPPTKRRRGRQLEQGKSARAAGGQTACTNVVFDNFANQTSQWRGRETKDPGKENHTLNLSSKRRRRKLENGLGGCAGVVGDQSLQIPRLLVAIWVPNQGKGQRRGKQFRRGCNET